MSPFTLHRVLSLACFLLVLSACDSGGNDDREGPDDFVGSAQVTLAGALNDTFSGSAVFVPEDTGGFIITLVNGGPMAPAGNNFKAVSFVGFEDDEPSGTRVLGGDEGIYTLYTVVESGKATVIVNADAGSVTFTTSSANRLVGTFEFTGTALDGDLDELGEVTLKGQFDARTL